MSLRIHICNDENAANQIIETEKLRLENPLLQSQQLSEPEIVIFDYSQDPHHPLQVNSSKVCVLFDD
jgi:hypothetical protein